MKHFHWAEIVLAVVFLGAFITLAVRTWGDFFFLHGLAIAAIFLPLTSLLILLMIRQHRGRLEREGHRRSTGSQTMTPPRTQTGEGFRDERPVNRLDRRAGMGRTGAG